MERRYGRADRIWVGDRGHGVGRKHRVSCKQSGRRYIVGTPKSMLKKFEQELLAEDWQAIREGLEVKLCPSPDGDETFVLCRSRDRREKEKAMHERFEQRIEEGLEQIAAELPAATLGAAGRRRSAWAGCWARTAGRRACSRSRCKTAADGRAILQWKKVEAWRDWAGSERRLLSAAQQRHGLERRGTVEGVHPIDRGRGGVPHPQERPADPPDLAPEGGAGAGPHPGLLPGLRAVEDAGADVPSRPGWATSRVGCSRNWARSPGGRGAAHPTGRGDPPALRHPAHGPPGDPAPTASASASPRNKKMNRM